MKIRRRLRKLEARIAALEGARWEPPAKVEIPTVDLNPQELWRVWVADYAHGYDDEDGWRGRYL